MSRTFRRKNYEVEKRTSWYNQGGKLAGFYTKREFNWVDGYASHTYEVPTEAEYSKEYWNYHSDRQSRHVRTGPNKWYRFFTIHQYRMQDKAELRKFMKNEDYEPMCRNRISSGYWD